MAMPSQSMDKILSRPVIEHLDMQKLIELFRSFEAHIVDNRPGINSEQREWIIAQKNLYAELRKIKQAEAENRPISPLRREAILAQGIDPETIELTTATILHDFFSTIGDVAEYLTAALEEDYPLKHRRGDKPSFELMGLGAKANISFLRFFLRTQKMLHLADDEVSRLYFTLFAYGHQDNLRAEMGLVDLDNFPPGILAALRAYFELKSHADSNTHFKVPQLNEDLNWGVDLVSETHDETGKKLMAKGLYQIKGRNTKQKTEIFDLSKQADRTRLEDMINGLPLGKQQTYRQSRDTLMAYRDKEQERVHEKNPQCIVTAYWVEVFTPENETDKES